MILTLNLTPEEEKRVEQARQRGFDVDAMLHGVIAGLPPVEAGPAGDKTLELFARWKAEDATDDSAEIEAAERELAEFKANMNANRALTGERQPYK
ncbi:MAG TPA: hypothetical protein VFA07_08995 [Chthonomonadaceae bacterium]|nr:hypothetical protein [Chthonomonadaceae bacterium]